MSDWGSCKSCGGDRELGELGREMLCDQCSRVVAARNLLAAELRAGRTAAVRRLRAALTSAGSLRSAAPALGVSVKTLQGWALRGGTRSIAAVVEAVDELGMRR